MANSKIPFIALAVTLLLSLLSTISLTNPAAATPDEVRWSRVNIPTEGETGNWVLASGSSIQHLTMAIDDTIYGYANPSGTSYTLFKSTDAGYSWSHSGTVNETIVAIATAADNANIVYGATVSSIYKSTDAGISFTLLLSLDGAGSDNITIADIDVARLNSKSIIAVGTRDSDSSQYGGVYILDENKPFIGWTNTKLGNYDVLAIAFSPNFTTDRQLVAVVTDEKDTLVTTRIGDANWGKVIGGATIKGLSPRAAAITFPDDYDATTEDHTLFVALDTGSDKGDVYVVNARWAPGSSIATDLDIGSVYNLSNVDVTGLAVSGNILLAGAANSAQVYISTNNSINWTRSSKPPTGQSNTYLLMAPDFASSGLAYAATSGNESAFSYTTDGGVTWNQVGLIDTTISDIRDLAVSPNYSQDNTLFMLTKKMVTPMSQSLWRSRNGGAKWERVFTSTLASADSINLVEFSPQYGGGSQAVFLVGTSGSNSAIWKSIDNGQTFKRRDAPFSIDTWAVVNDSTFFLGSYDGSNGLVYHTTNSGLSYSTRAVAGSQPLASIALSPNYQQDETLLLGNANGWVYWSSNNGTSFRPLGQQLPKGLSPTDISNISVAFDPKFSSNKVVYATSDTKTTDNKTTLGKERIYRFTIGKSDAWESIDSTLPVGSMLRQFAVSADGTLYAANFMANGGMERSLNPTYPLSPTFETVTRGLDDGATLTGLWIRGNQLWSIDSKNTRLMTYTDSLPMTVTLTSPPNKAPGIGTGSVRLEWETLKGATEYQWQLDYDSDFSTVPAEFEGETKASSARLPALEPATTYYWRVRATEPVLSPWSAKWSFTTSLSSMIIAPELYSPEAGASEMPLKPVFQWSAIAGADSYELLVSTDASFSNPIIVKIGDYALPATAWQSDISLDYNTTYYWKVRASGSSSYSAWSAVGAFTTELPPPQPSSAPELSLPSPTASPSPALSPPPPPSPAQSTFPDWFIYLAGALLLTTVLLLITILVLVVGIRRS